MDAGGFILRVLQARDDFGIVLSDESSLGQGVLASLPGYCLTGIRPSLQKGINNSKRGVQHDSLLQRGMPHLRCSKRIRIRATPKSRIDAPRIALKDGVIQFGIACPIRWFSE